MNIGLFIPCYMDQMYPAAAMATVAVLEAQGVAVDFPRAQTCCGQPMANSGCTRDAAKLATRFVDIFAPYEYIVCPSGSCTAMVRHHYHGLVPDSESARRVCAHTYELCEFLVDILKVERVQARFPHKVGLHVGCHGLRELRLGRASERMDAPYSKVERLLRGVDGLELVTLSRPDECCGFGGTFAVQEEAVSCRMGRDRVADHARAGAEFIVSTDSSCLMHMAGLISREGPALKVLHVAEVLAGGRPA
ncbi:MAG: (Fe-S)-binding protein [Lentisphaerae bacterium]|nr:(Fe-S)-binding protein [Lentisphaerota bacterium]